MKVISPVPSTGVFRKLNVIKKYKIAQNVPSYEQINNIDVYYPMGKVSHLNDYDKGNVKYTIDEVENSDGKFICIREERQNRLGSHTVCKGIAIPVELIDKIVETLNKVK